MSPDDLQNSADAFLRAEAEARLNATPPSGITERPIAELLHELQVHQIELEMQNETLRQAQTALAESRDRYLDLYEFAPVGYLSLSSDGLITEINLTGAELLGVERKNLLQRRFGAYVGAADSERWSRHFIGLKVRGEQNRIELALVRRDGTVFQAQLDSRPFDASCAKIRITLTDISERKASEINIATLLQKQQAILHSDVVGFVMLERGVMTWMNDAYARTLGYETAELVNRPARMLYPDEETYLSFEAAAYSLIRSRRTFRTQTECVRKDGSTAWFDISGSQLGLGGNESIWSCLDVSAQKRTEAALVISQHAAEAANHAKSRFLATMSHEIRTPMNGILGMAQMLVLPNLEDAERIKCAQVVVDSGRALMALLSDILDLSKVEAGKFELESIAYDARQLINESVTLFAESAMLKGLRIDANWFGPDGQRYFGDPHRLRQMLYNLVSNAIKFTPHGSIRIEGHEVERDGAGVLLEFAVSDSGVGVPQDKQDLLFEPFSQVDSSTTRKYGGTGLGLSIVRGLAWLMGGEVGVDSKPGQGSRFWFRIRANLDPNESEIERT